MKKIVNIMMAVAIAAGSFTFTACEDVPEPYNNPYDQRNTEPEETVEPAGAGTLDDPYNVARALEVCTSMEADAKSDNVYAKGVVTAISEISTQFGNATFTISDNGSNALTVYRAKGLNNESITDASIIAKGDTVIIYGQLTNFKGNTPEFTQGCYIYSIVKGEGGGDTPALEAPGTADAPYTVAQALDYMDGLGADNLSPVGYVKGIVASISEVSTQYGNATYLISDDGTENNTLQIYRGKGLGGASFTSVSELNVGDVVIVSGQLINFKGNTKQFAAGSTITSLNGQTAGGGGDTPAGEAQGDGTLENPYNAVAATQAASALSVNTESANEVYIRGKISRIANNGRYAESGTYGNATFYISDDGTTNNEFYIFHTLYLGNTKYTTGTDINVGDEVIICGKLYLYQGSQGNQVPETAGNKSYLYSLNGQTGEGGSPNDNPSGNTSTKDNPYSVTMAVEMARALSSSESIAGVYVHGVVVELESYSDSYHNSRYYIADDAASNDRLYIFDGKGLDNTNFNSLDDLKLGDEVTVFGTLVNYQGTLPEMGRGNYLVFHNGTGSNPGDTPGGGDDVTDVGTNGDFESWTNGQPDNWKTTSTAGNATLSQSTDAHGGVYSVKVSGDAKANKRLGYREMALKSGTYHVSFYAKALSEGGTVNPGFVPVTNGSAGTYKYSGYVDNVSTTDWQLVDATLEIPTDGTYSFVVMNQKKSAAVDILIDDFIVTKGNTVVIR